MSVKLPSVTQIIKDLGLGMDYSKVPRETLEWAALRGTALHAAIQYHHEGTLDEASISPVIRPAFTSYRRFLVEKRHIPIASEIELIHPVWHYCGHPDRVGWHDEAERVIVDWKMVADFDPEAYKLQLAGYKLAWNAMHPLEPVDKVFGLHLPKAGGYKLHDLTDPLAEQTFLACVLVWRERQRRGKV